MSFGKSVLKIVLPLLFVVSHSAAQWTDNPLLNTRVDTNQGNQTAPRLVSDDVGGMIVVWQDSRDSLATGINIFAKRLNQSGIAVWTAPVCRSTGNQSISAVIRDGQGGAIIAWTDPRNGNTDVYVQRVSNLGAVSWKTNGVEICLDTSNQGEVALVSDGDGGAILAWKDFRNGASNPDIYAQRISQGGGVQWAVNGVPICAATGEQGLPGLATDGVNGAIIAWQDARTSVNTDIYAQRVLANGTRSWAVDGLSVSTAAGRQKAPQILSDAEQGAYIVWEDTRNGNSDVFAHRINGSGAAKLGWAANGTAVCTSPGEQTIPVAIGTGLGGIIAAWQDTRNVTEDIYAQNLDADGVIQWPIGGVAVSTAPGQQLFPVITDDGPGGAIVAWQDHRSGNADVFAQSLNSGGLPEWTVDGVPISTESHDQELPVMISDGSKGAILAWQDHRLTATYKVFAQIVNSSGLLGLISITGVLFNDVDDNGVFDTTDTRLNRWRVFLTGAATAIDTTDVNGLYSFTNLSPGNYTVRGQDSAGWKHTYPNTVGDTLLILDSAITGVNFGNFELGTVTGRVYDDKNENGIIEAGEPGLTQGQRVRVKLGGTLTRELDSDGSGNYRFVGLPSGNYFVTIVPQGSQVQTFPADTPSVSLVHGGDAVFNFSVFGLGQIKGQVYTDLIADSVWDKGDSVKPLNGFTVRLYKNDSLMAQSVSSGIGNYAFTGLHIGSYSVRQNLPALWVQTSPDSSYDTVITSSYQLKTLKHFLNFRTGTISGNLYFDAGADSAVTGDAPVKDWTLRIFDTLGTAIDTVITNGAGFFAFEGLMPGKYLVAESVQTGWYQTFPKVPKPLNAANKDTLIVIDSLPGTTADQRAYLVSIDSSGRSRPKRSFGNFRRAQITGSVFKDRNGDGGWDEDETGVPGWTLQLTGTATNGSSVSKSTASDGDGKFLFDNLAGGTYTVRIVRKTGWKVTRPTTADYYSVSLQVGSVATGKNFGARLAGFLYGQVFLDLAGDGEKSEADSALAGRRLLLKNPASGWVLDSTMTDVDGNFLFDTLAPGLYRVDELLDPGWKITNPVPSIEIIDLEESDAMSIANFKLGTIAGTVFNDLNGDAVNTAEPPMPGCTVLLKLQEAGQPDVTIAEAATNGSGGYSFGNIEPGSYKVVVKKPVGWKQTTPADGFTAAITTSGQALSNFNFGGYDWNTISGTLFFDGNGNGALDAGEPPLPGMTVFLAGSDSVVFDTTHTAANGVYQFSGLPKATYIVTVAAPATYYQTLPDSAGGRAVTVSSSPEDLTGTDFGYFAGSISGLVSNDLNGDGVVDPGEPPAAGWTLTLSGPLSRTTQSDSTGAYLFGGLKPGSYSVQVENRAGWIHTWPGAPGDAPASLDSLNPSRTGIDFANFQLVTISGLMFDDANRNGTRDLAEGVLTNRTVTLTKGLSNVNTLTDGGGNYHFSGVSGGTYTVTQTGPPGYNQSYPAPPGTHEITTYSGEAVPGRNFGNFQSVQNSIVVRCLGDNDGDFSTLADATTKPWTLKLYLNAVGGTPLTPASATTSSIYFSNLAAGTYYAVIADSAGWTRLGSVVDGVPTAGTETTAVVVHSLGEAHQVNMIVFRPNSLLVRAWSDADGRFATAADRDTLTWDLSVYRKFVAPANLVASAAGVESLLVENLGNGTYIAVEGDSAGWKHLGTIPGDSGSSNNRSVSLSGGSSATVEFVNTEVGSIAVAALTDEDGFAATDTDRAPIAWRLRAYRDAEAPENLVRDDSSSGLLLSNLAVGTYVVTQTTTQGGSAWSQVGTILDGVMDSTIKTSKATIILATGESRTVGFVNFDPRRKKTWTAAEDGEWNNARNWNPQFIPRPIDTVVIAPTALACIPEMPRGLSFPSLTVAADGALSFAGDDTLRRDLRVDGSLVADADSTSVLTVGRNWDGSGSFIPGSSLADFPRGIVHTVSGMDFHDLRLDTNTTGTPSNLRATGNVRVSGTFSLLGSFDAGNDTLFILSDRPEAIADSGTVVAGALNRAIRTDTTGLAYRFESESTYVAFADTARIPAEVAMRVYRSTPASSFADAWEVIGINPRRSPGSVAVDSVTRLSRFRAITLGRIIAGKPTPTVNRVYSAHAEGDSGFTATLSLAYAAGEVVGIPMPDSLLVLAMKFAARESVSGGWNMVSVPVRPDDFRKNHLFPGAISNAFSYSPDASGYANRDTLDNGEGYWVKFGRDTIASIVGSVRLSDTLRVRKGWNIIGALSEPVPVEAVQFIPPNLGRGQFFGFERGYLAASVLEPMRAYWVNVSDSGSIILAAVASSAAPKTAVSPAVTAEAASAGVIIVTDAAGGRQRLLLGKGKISAPSLYALPPPGPAGAFDARFGSGTMFETYAGGESPEEFVLRISSASYPVTVSWEMPPSSAERISIAGLATGGAVPMRGGGSMTLTNPAVNSLRIIVDGNSTLPETYSLLQSYPNPFNPTATIRYELPEPALVTITIYDVLGRRVEALVDGQSREAGRFEAVFNGAGRASGVYFYKITAQGQSTRFERVMKMLLLK